MWPIEPHARTSTILNPTGSFDFKRLTYSLARTSPASKWVTPFCSGNPCFATFSLWKLKNTNLPRNRDSPVLRLITSGALSSAFTAKLLLELVVVVNLSREVLAWVMGLRPWNGERLWRCFWTVGVRNKVEVAIGGGFRGKLRERWCCLWRGEEDRAPKHDIFDLWGWEWLEKDIGSGVGNFVLVVIGLGKIWKLSPGH